MLKNPISFYSVSTVSLHDFEKTAALQILVYLIKRGEASRTDLRENIEAAMETIYSALIVLSRLKLVEEKKSNRFPFIKQVYLTDKGRKVAEYLVDIEKILKGVKESERKESG